MNRCFTAIVVAVALGCGSADDDEARITDQARVAVICDAIGDRWQARVARFHRDDLFAAFQDHNDPVNKDRRRAGRMALITPGIETGAVLRISEMCLTLNQCRPVAIQVESDVDATLATMNQITAGLHGLPPCADRKVPQSSYDRRRLCGRITDSLAIAARSDAATTYLAQWLANGDEHLDAYERMHEWRTQIELAITAIPFCVVPAHQLSCIAKARAAASADPTELVEVMTELAAAFENGTSCDNTSH